LARIGINRAFTIFWLGQSLSSLGDAFALIAMPLLVLQATGSVSQMGLVTGAAGIAQLIAGLFAGLLVDRLDRRRLMIICDLGRAILYSAIPAGWWLLGPQIWLIYVVTVLGSLLGMCFQVAYITAVSNLVEREALTEANGRLQATVGVAFVLGPVLAGLVSARVGPAAAIGVDAISFLASAASLLFIRLRRAVATRQANQEGSGSVASLLAGARFLFAHPVLRAVTIVLAVFTFATTGSLDLFIFYLKHDLHQSDNAVGFIFGLACVGAIGAGLAAATLRRRLGFGVCWLGGIIGMGVILCVIALVPGLVTISIVAPFFSMLTTVMGIISMSLRQEITPDHLLGRVTAAFWTLSSAAGPVGAALATALAAHLGVLPVLGLIGIVVLALGVAGAFTPARQRSPEHWTREGLALRATA
jgi:MFS family permease